MLHKAIFACVAFLLLVTAGEARQRAGLWTGKCWCKCVLPNAAQIQNLYDPLGGICEKLENRTCNATDPDTGLVRTGELRFCAKQREGEIPPKEMIPIKPVTKPKHPIPGTQVQPPTNR
jgi:hypothetical protein